MEEFLKNDGRLLFLLVVPGFVALRLYDLLVPSVRRNWSEALVEVVSVGTINLVVVGQLLEPFMNQGGWRAKVAWAILLFGSPLLLALLTIAARGSELVQRWLPHPVELSWDKFFAPGAAGERRRAFVACRLKDGGMVGGFFGSDSFASSAPGAQELYLEEAWKMDENGDFLERVAGTQGLHVRRDDCWLIEFREEGAEDVEIE